MRPGERNRERGRVRDISSQYHLRTLTTKILASLNRRCTVTELFLPKQHAPYRVKAHRDSLYISNRYESCLWECEECH
ncbi:hypothetical protein ACB092_11G052300 [Castanea dentata]